MAKAAEYNRLAPAVNRSFSSKVNKWSHVVQRWLYPAVCTLCGGAGDEQDICRGCADDLAVANAACLHCALPLLQPGTCGRCQRRPPDFDRAVAAFQYQAPVDGLVKRLKFSGDLRLARLLGTLLAERLAASLDELPEVIVPVPLHPGRLRQRGYNQALELARPIARRMKVPLEWRRITRVRATDPQTDLPAKLRSRNVKDAFAVAADFKARRVAIVDDVMTTGHTANELAIALRRAGVVEISVWVCARAVFAR